MFFSMWAQNAVIISPKISEFLLTDPLKIQISSIIHIHTVRLNFVSITTLN